MMMTEHTQGRPYGFRLLLGLTIAFASTLCAFEYGKPNDGRVRYAGVLDLEDNWIEQDLVEVDLALPKPPVEASPPVKILSPQPVPDPTRFEIVDHHVPEPGETPPFEPEPVYIAPEPVIEPVLLPVEIAEFMPEFPGGEKALMKYLAAYTRYPVIARERRIEGIVYVRFMITAKGSIDPTSIEILRSPHPSLSEEAVRVVKSMPDWKPGRQGGRRVPVYMKLPIRFVLR
jgi:protein TonB